jgi:hypothetical protein
MVVQLGWEHRCRTGIRLLADDWDHAQVTMPWALVLQARELLGEVMPPG